MKLQGFIGPAYTLDSVNVAAQSLVNMYPEVISPGLGKNAQRMYFKATPGLTEIADLGDGPIRCKHQDALGRTFIVSGNKVYCLAHKDHFKYIPRIQYYESISIVQGAGTITVGDDSISDTHGFYTGLKVRVSSTGTLPAGLGASTDYYVIAASSGVYRLASSLANAVAGTPVDITDVGSGTMTTTPQLSNAIFWVGNSAVSIADNQFTMKDHGLWSGQHIQMITDGTLPTGLSENTDYYVIRVDADNFKLATSVSNASSGTAVDITALYSATTWVSRLMTSKGLDQTGSAFTLNTSSGRVKAASSKNVTNYSGNNFYTVFTDGSELYMYTDLYQLVTGAAQEGLAATGNDLKVNFPTWVDSRFSYILEDTDTFYVSDIQSVNIGENFASAEGNPDKLLALIDNYRQLYLFGERTTEVFTNTGNSDFPYERVPGGFIEIGTSAKHSVAKIKDTIFFLGRTEEGANEVYRLNGTVPEKISTPAIDQAIAGYADPSACTAYTYSSKGHFFYVMNFAEATWVYDLSTGLWHQRAYTNAGTLERHLVEEMLYFPQENLLLGGHYNDGKIFSFDDSVYSDNGDAITRLRSSPHLTNEDMWVFYNEFTLDMETGIGLDGSVQGSNPTVMLDFSDDGGHTWSSESFALADAGSGTIGDFRKEVQWRRLGKSKSRIFRVKMTDPVKCVWIDAFIKYKLGAN